MRLTIVESPYRGHTESEQERNVIYLRMCLRDSILRGEAPFASHAIYPFVLDDQDEVERGLGIRLGYEWWRAATLVAFYTDLGWSEGMMAAGKKVRTSGLKWEERSITCV